MAKKASITAVTAPAAPIAVVIGGVTYHATSTAPVQQQAAKMSLQDRVACAQRRLAGAKVLCVTEKNGKSYVAFEVEGLGSRQVWINDLK